MKFLRLFLRDVTIKDVANHGTYSNPGRQVWAQNENRVCAGHGKPGKSWKMKVLFGRLDTTDDKARQGQLKIKRSS